MSGPRDEAAWERALPRGRPGRPGAGYFALLGLACLALGALVAGWALRLL